MEQSVLAKFTTLLKQTWPFLLFWGLPFLAFPEIIFGNQTLYWTDLSWIHYPRHIFAAEEWLAGRVPLWDPYQHNGLPFLAESQVGALYPFSALFLSAASPSLELSLFILIHFSLAATFTFLLARLLGISQPAAVVAGLAYGCGGFMMAQVPNLNIMTGAVWLPLILYGLIQATRRRTLLSAMLAGIPLTLQILTAQPQIVFYTLVMMCGYTLYRVAAGVFFGEAQTKKRLLFSLQTVGLVAITLITGLLLAAPQLLPTFELQQLSVRSQERDIEFLTQNSLPPLMWLNLLIPSAFGNNVTGFKGGDPFQEDFIYIGFLPLVFVFFSWGQRHKRDMPFFVLLLIGGALLAMGRMTPLYQTLVQYLPGFALFRVPSRWLMVVNLALAVLAGFGLDAVCRRGLRKKQFFIFLGTISLILIAVGLIWFFSADLQAWSQSWSREAHQKFFNAFLKNGYIINPIYQDRLVIGWLTVLAAPVPLLVVNVMAATGVFWLLATRKITANAFSLLVIAVVSIDLVAAGGTTINPTKPDNWWRQLSGGAQYVLDNLDEGRVFPLGMGSEALTVSHLGQYFPSVYRVRSAGGHGSSLMLQRAATFLQNAHPVQAIRALGVRYLLTEGQLGADAAATYPLVFGDGSSFVYENSSPYPRAFVVHQIIQVDTPPEAMAYFETANLDPRQTVVIEAGGNLPSPAEPSAPDSTDIIHETPQRIELTVNAAADGYLVLLDTYYPGWVAHRDGQPVPIYRANYISRAIFVPSGRHTIEFEYRPQYFRVGIWLFALTSVMLIGLIIITGRVQTNRLKKLE